MASTGGRYRLAGYVAHWSSYSNRPAAVIGPCFDLMGWSEKARHVAMPGLEKCRPMSAK